MNNNNAQERKTMSKAESTQFNKNNEAMYDREIAAMLKKADADTKAFIYNLLFKRV